MNKTQATADPQAAEAVPVVTDAQWRDAQARGWPGTRAEYAAWRKAKDAHDAGACAHTAEAVADEDHQPTEQEIVDALACAFDAVHDLGDILAAHAAPGSLVRFILAPLHAKMYEELPRPLHARLVLPQVSCPRRPKPCGTTSYTWTGSAPPTWVTRFRF